MGEQSMTGKGRLTAAVLALKHGEEGAPAALYKVFCEDLHAYILNSVNDPELATELTQETFLEIFDTIDSLEEIDLFVEWSRQIADRRCIAMVQNRIKLLSGKTNLTKTKQKSRVRAVQSFFRKVVVGIVIAVVVACLKEGIRYLYEWKSISNVKETEASSVETIAMSLTTTEQEGMDSPELKSTENECSEEETAGEESEETEPTGTESADTESTEPETVQDDTESEMTQEETIAMPEVGSMVTVGDFQLTWRGTYYEVTDVSEMPEYIAYIPSEHEGLPIASIGEHAFEAMYIGRLIIPKSITHIEETAFRRCYGSEIVIVEEGNPVYHSIGTDCLIETASGTVIHGRRQIPADAGILHIGAYAYSGSGTSDLVIPEGVVSLGERAFEYSNRTKTLTIPSSVTYIGKEAFIGCSNLTSIIYHGTRAQWEAIEKGTNWDRYTGAFVIHCADGDI